MLVNYIYSIRMAKSSAKALKEHVRFEARITPQLKKMFTNVAAMQGTNLTNFVVSSAKKEAESILKERVLIDLSLEDMKFMVDSCLAGGGEPNDRMKKAGARYKASITS